MLDVLIVSAALAANIDPNLLKAIIMVESRGRNVVTHNDGKDKKPSYGPGQIKYNTAKFVAKLNGLTLNKKDLNQPSTNLIYSALYLKYQLNRYNGRQNCAIEAYNKGTARKCNGKYVNKVKRELANVRH